MGLAALTSAGVISPDYTNFVPAAVIIGGFLFGVGIILAGGCPSGTWYRSGEGLVGSWVTLAMYALSAAAMKGGALGGLTTWLKGRDTGWTTVLAALGVFPWLFVIALAVLTGVLTRHFLRREAHSPKPTRLEAPAARVHRRRPRRSAVRDRLAAVRR